MSLVALEIPDDPLDWPSWLERELVGLRLGELIDELRVIAGKEATLSPSLSEILGGSSREVCELGLSALSREQFASFWNHPERLLELQALVFTSGGMYWRKLELASKSNEAVERSWRELQGSLHNEQEAAPRPLFSTPRRTNRRTWTTATFAGIAAIAAMLLAAAWLGLFSPQVDEWGWLRSDTFASQQTDAKFLELLAERAGEWDHRPRGHANELKLALTDFRKMCDLLQKSKLEQLTNQADRDWLKERCTKWAEKIDRHLSELDRDDKPVDVVSKEATETIHALQKALVNRAGTLAV